MFLCLIYWLKENIYTYGIKMLSVCVSSNSNCGTSSIHEAWYEYYATKN
jgi:hypothetical protein